MSLLEPEDECSLYDFDEKLLLEPISPAARGIVMLPENYGDLDAPIIKADAGDFSKWLKRSNPDIEIEINTKPKKLVLRSGDYWLPLVFLASDITLPIYLNLVSNYLYDKMRGALKGDNARVHLSAIYEDKKEGKLKRFEFEGDTESLKSAIKRFDLNGFLDD